jgi:ATP-binding cassette, subfamily B, bacterial
VLDARGSLPYGAAAFAEPGPARLEVRDARFGHAGGAPVLHDVSLTIEPGRTVAIVGPTAAGKSTLAGLLVRLVDPDAGVVMIDGVDARAAGRGEVPRIASLVAQETFLFDDTVRGNVTLGLDLSDEQVWAALRRAQADGFVTELPAGLDTRIGERGATLSGGQRQRLALARALARRPRLLVLDDATSSVDPRVEARILGGLREAQATGSGSTVIVIAYRKATIALADEVVYMEHGRIMDQGTHAELLTRSAGYQNLVTAYERAESERIESERAEDAERAARGEPSGRGAARRAEPVDAGEEALAQ